MEQRLIAPDERPATIERRRKPRTSCPFIARVRGVDTGGEVFDLHTITDNLSASGLYMRMPREFEEGGKLFIVIHLSDAKKIESEQGGCIAMRGVVVRTDSYPDGLCGIGVKFSHHRFI